MLERNPLRGYKPPMEKNPVRVVLGNDEYRALREVSDGIDWRFSTALVLAHETGHRIGAIRALRWSDVDLEEGTVRWRAEHEKNGYEHRTPLTKEAVAALEEARRQNPSIGDTPVFPAPKDPQSPSTGTWPGTGGRRPRSLRRLNQHRVADGIRYVGSSLPIICTSR